MLGLAGQKLINGPAHASIGQEAGAVGSGLPLVGADQVNGSHRGHHQFLAKAIGYVAPDGSTRAAAARRGPRGAAQEHGGDRRAQGRLLLRPRRLDAPAVDGRRRDGHERDRRRAVPFAAGFAFADKWADTDNVSVTYFGDGATNIGSVLETMNLAAAWKLPVCFFIENNQYAVSTTVQEATGEPRLSARGLGFGIPSWQVDGQDVVAVYLAMQQACEHMRNGGGPTVVEADTYRYFHQNGPFPGSAFGYRTKIEESAWRERDPIAKIESSPRPPRPLHRGRARRRPQVDQGGDGGDRGRPGRAGPDGKPGQQRIRPELWPDPAFLDVGIRGDLSSLEGLTVREEADFDADELEQRKFVDVVADVMGHRMETTDHRRHGRGRAPAQRRLARRHQGAQGEVRGPRARHADLRVRLHRPRRRPGAGRPVLPGGRADVRRLHLGRGRPDVQPDRQGPAHVRRRPRHAAAAAHQDRHRHRLRLPALDGPGRHPGHRRSAGGSSRRPRRWTTSAWSTPP